MKPIVALMLLAVCSAWYAEAAAQTQDATAAEVMFQAGRAALEQGDYATACEKFQESQRLEPMPGNLLNIASCAEKLGQLALAWSSYKEAMRLIPASDRRREYAATQLAQLEARVPWLTIRLAAGVPKETQVIRDRLALSTAALGVPFPVDPGELRVTVRAPGHHDRLYRLTTVEGGRHEFTLELGEALPAQPKTNIAPVRQRNPHGPKPPARAKAVRAGQDSASGGSTLGWVLGGVGVAGLLTSGVSALVILDRKSTLESECDADGLCSDVGLEARDSGRTWNWVGSVSFAAGASALLGAYLVLSRDSSGSTSIGAEQAHGGASLRLWRSF